MKNSDYNFQKFGSNVKRIKFGKTKKTLEPFDLLLIQKEAFTDFLDNKIHQAFKNVFPIESSKGNVRIEYISSTIEVHDRDKLGYLRNKDVVVNGKKKKEPIFKKWSWDWHGSYFAIKEAKEKGKTYSGKLKAKLKLINEETGVVSNETVLFGDIPLMTKGASFIVNGSEKIIVSQLVRAPGAYFELEVRLLGDDLFNKLSIMPGLGVWLEIYNKVTNNKKDTNDWVKVKIDKKKAIPITTFLRSFGLMREDILDLFGDSDELIKTFKKEKKLETQSEALDFIYKAIRPGDRVTQSSKDELYPNMFFNKKRFDLTSSGRYMVNRKLSLIDRITNTFLLENLTTKEGVILFKKDTFITSDIALDIQNKFIDKLLPLKKFPNISNKIYSKQLEKNPSLKSMTKGIIVKVYKIKDDLTKKNYTVIANNPENKFEFLTVDDIMASISYYFNLLSGLGSEDDIDSLKNKRVRTIGELLENQLKIGLSWIETNTKERMSAREVDKITPKNVISNKLITKSFTSFLNSSQLSQFMDQMNPLSEVSNKRRVTSLGPGGLSRDAVVFRVRDVHHTHYGRICPIETPEGPSIGLILNFAIYSRINNYGFIETPYFKVHDGIVNYNEYIFLTAIEEEGVNIAQSSIDLDENNKIKNKEIMVRNNGEYKLVSSKDVNYLDVASNQLVSIASSAIPFLENDDANRTLMGANMQRQAVPLVDPSSPVVATGTEEIVARFSPTNITSMIDGKVSFVDSQRIEIEGKDSKKHIYNLRTFERSNQGSVISQRPIVSIGDKVKQNQLLTDGPSFKDGELALGKNVLVALTTWNGFNYEDAIIVSERLVKDDVYTSLHIEKYEIQFRKAKIGNDILTTEIPNVSNFSKRWLDSNGIVRIGSEVSAGDILVGRISPKGEENLTPEERLVVAIFSERSKSHRDTSLKVKHGQGGTVIDVDEMSRENGDKLDDDVEKIIKVYIAQKRKIKVGDKMAGRHGNKGVISRVLPIEDMPHLEDGTPIDIMLNPLGVPSRMNIGQVLELHLGMIAREMNVKFATPIFDGAKPSDISKMLVEANLPETGKFTLFDSITGEKFDNPVAVGIMYMLKLSHMVDDKMHARSVGPYSLITQQPLGGKSQNGGQRFGEMEVWALEAYGASNLLQEILTYKSDDISGRNRLYNSIAHGKHLPRPGTPESFNVLQNELRGLLIKTELLNDNENENREDDDE